MSLVAGWWAVEPVAARPVPSGSNNVTVLLECGDGTVVARVRAEHRLLAELDTALATLPVGLAPVVWSGRLDDITPSIRDLGELCRGLQVDPVLALYASWFRAALGRHRVRTDLPRHVVHGNVGYSTVLVEEARVSAVLDFEIAGADLRVNDLVAALAACTHAPDPADDDHVGALCGGFGSVLRLAPAEVEALPDLLRGRALRSVVWWAGHWLRGQAPVGEVADRLAAGQAYDVALERHGSRLVDLVTPLLTLTRSPG
jgi:homoserine kinase type II